MPSGIAAQAARRSNVGRLARRNLYFFPIVRCQRPERVLSIQLHGLAQERGLRERFTLRRVERSRALAPLRFGGAAHADAARQVENLEGGINPWNGTGAVLSETAWQHNGLVGGATP